MACGGIQVLHGELTMAQGTVKWFDAKKGFGFLLNSQGQDVFVHFSSILGEGFRSLKDGEPVEFEEADGARGLHARWVKRTTRKSKAAAEEADASGQIASPVTI